MFDVPMPTAGLRHKNRHFNEEHSPKLRQQHRQAKTRGIIRGQLFAIFFGLLVINGYILMGASWLILKTEGDLQKKAVRWARRAIWSMVACALLSSLTAPFVDTRIYDRMFAFPEITLLIAMPLVSMMLTLLMHFLLGVLPTEGDRLAWMPFAISIFIFVLGFLGLVYSFYPYIIPGHLLIVDAAAAPESLMIILVGTLIVLPCLIGYTALAYKVFSGKARDLSSELKTNPCLALFKSQVRM